MTQKNSLNLEKWTSPRTANGGPRITQEQVKQFIKEVRTVMNKLQMTDIETDLEEFNKIYQPTVGSVRSSARGLGAVRTNFGKMCEQFGLRVRGIVNSQGHFVRMTLIQGLGKKTQASK